MTTGHGPVALWAAIAAIGIGTYAIRVSFLYLFGRLNGVPAGVEATLRYVPPAVLAALAVPAVVTTRPSVTATLLDPRVGASVVAFAVAWLTENVVATLVVGMGTLWVLRFLVV